MDKQQIDDIHGQLSELAERYQVGVEYLLGIATLGVLSEIEGRLAEVRLLEIIVEWRKDYDRLCRRLDALEETAKRYDSAD